MTEKINAFSALLQKEEVKEKLSLGQSIKKLDKSNEKKLVGIILFSIISMTVLGFISLGLTGSIIFFCVTVISSFWLYYSSKKNILLKYLTFYRRDIPKIIALAENIEVKSENIPETYIVSSLSQGKPTYRMCHKYKDIYIGFLKFMAKDISLLEGIVYFAEGFGDTSLFEEKVSALCPDFILKKDEGKAVLLLPGFGDYLGGRVEMKDDLSEDFLIRQYKYYLLGDAFKKSLKNESFEIPEI